MITEKIVNSIELLVLLGAIFVGLFIVFFIEMIITGKKDKYFERTIKILSDNYLFFGFIVSLVSMLGSLFYSEIMGYTPCVLCWYQRIFMYPLPFLFLIAMIKKDRRMIVVNSIVLSIFGAVLALYHYLSQVGIMNSTICDIVGYSVNCSEFFSLAYGFITIPMMALVAFLMIIILGASRSFLKD